MVGRNAQHAQGGAGLPLAQIGVADEVLGGNDDLAELLRRADAEAVAVREDHDPHIVAPQPRLAHQARRPQRLVIRVRGEHEQALVP